MRPLSALVLVVLLLLVPLAGCIGSDEVKEVVVAEEEDEEEAEQIELNVSVDSEKYSIELEEALVIEGEISGWQLGLEVSMDLLDTRRNYLSVDAPEFTFRVDDDGGMRIYLGFAAPGNWTFIPRISVDGHDSIYLPMLNIEVIAPEEDHAAILIQSMYELQSGEEFTMYGSISHDNLEFCYVEVILFDGAVRLAADLNDVTGSFEIFFGMLEESITGLLEATCGEWNPVSNNRSFLLNVLGNADDMDGDGIEDEFDSCPDGWGEEDGWSSSPDTDIDSDGCHDGWEDLDDDGDGINDGVDRCPSSPGWTSSIEFDHDEDGCRDSDEDEDDDDDGVLDELDSCPRGATKWGSGFASDWDSDGCRDADEDDDDDSDGLADISDSCAKGAVSWTRDEQSDWDSDGCRDSDEDIDDDADGVNDVNATGVPLDLCPFTEMNRTDVDENGCAGNQRDSDSDGVLDDEDLCPGTPLGNPVSEVGCSDLDGDGVFSNVDQCPDTPSRWTPDSYGCTVNQLPVAWNSGPYGSGRMDIVSTFSFPTLSGNNWNFANEWTGNDTYLFLFKYTDSNGNSNSGTWGYNPGTLIRALPDNVHLFYGSFDSTYHNDIVSRKADVESRLTTAEEEKWMPRIHFIDQRANSLNGGIADLIQNWGTFYYGIDRFQQSREIGSLHDWSQGASCCTNPKHIALEPHTWNTDYDYYIRTTDPGITKVEIFDEQWHNGGWQSGYNSYSNGSFPDAASMSAFDTMEVYAYHACEENRMRHSSGGCHEWDYLHYLHICDADNSSVCNTEFVRYITTYGREGQWLTDITPFLWMVQDGGDRRFKFSGANKMGVVITVLLSNWGENDQPFAAEYAFSGGQFKGEYNNQSQHKRQHLFTIPEGTDRVEIVATITGHGFNSDAANCSEFCNHEHHYSMNGFTAMEDHAIAGTAQGCQNLIGQGVIANQFGSWPYGRAGWCAGQDVKQWRYDITSWLVEGENNLSYRGLYQGQEYVPQSDTGGDRKIIAAIWLVYYNETGAAIGTNSVEQSMQPPPSIFDLSCDPVHNSACQGHLIEPPLNTFTTANPKPYAYH